jgi:hypothetical protein
MKKFLLASLAAGITLVLISWGPLGHHIVGEIAENHLTPKAKMAVHQLLGHETLADVSSWADDIRSQEQETAPWHFLNLPTGLSFNDFRKRVETMPAGNVYNAILSMEQTLKDSTAPKYKRVEALKFLVHFVGDAHQPMHVSRAEDKGGNSIAMAYNNEPTNLHAIWDSKILEQDGTNAGQLAAKYDHATPAQIKKWQSDPVIIWVWESYQISSLLYAEVDTMKTTNVGKDYYDAHITIVQQRLEKAGIRLAGVLNSIFANANIKGK